MKNNLVKGLALVSKGLEDAAISNIIEILASPNSDKSDKSVKAAKDAATSPDDGLISFDADYNELCRLSYLSQAANRILLLLQIVSFEDYDDLIKKLSLESKDIKEFRASDVHGLINDGSTYRVSCISHDKIFDIQEIEEIIGSLIYEDAKIHGLKLKVNLKNPGLVFQAIIKNNKLYLGLDFSGDISKRDYKIFSSPLSLKGTTAFGLLKMVGYNPRDVMLNTFCNSGIIEIEAALYANRIPAKFYNKEFPFMKLKIKDTQKIGWEDFFRDIDERRLDKRLPITASDPLLRNITAAKKNAKIAGVEKFIDFRRIDVDWLDTKIEKKSVDKIVTFIAGSSKHKNVKALGKLYKEFFYQAEFIIKDSGTVIVLCLSKELLMESSKGYFCPVDQKEIWSGEQRMHVLFFRKILDK